jgi:hypothetical protein
MMRGVRKTSSSTSSGGFMIPGERVWPESGEPPVPVGALAEWVKVGVVGVGSGMASS